MALTGQLSDMSLAELIEFFCNQRKTGRLKVDYHRGHGVFFIKEGELVDAKVGQLSGAEAVYFALTLPNAAFDFSPEVQPTRRTITEAWTQVVLEGLRRLDEGLSPTEADAFGGWTPSEAEMALFMDQVERLGEGQSKKKEAKAAEAEPFSMTVESAGASGSGRRKVMMAGAAAAVVLAAVVAAIPLMRGKAGAGAAAQAVSAKPESQASAPAAADPSAPASAAEPAAVEVTATEADVAAAQREQREREQRMREQRERERRAEEAAKKGEDAQAAGAAGAPAAATTGPKSVRVTITYDEAGRVTAASVAGASPGAEAFAGTAVRIARGKRFPAGKPGSTVITIPVN